MRPLLRNALLLLAVTLCVAGRPAARDTEWSAALAAGELERAHEMITAAPPQLERERALAELHYRASDPARSYAVAARATDEYGEDPELLFRMAGSALWLRDGERATGAAERLRAALDTSEDLVNGEQGSPQDAAAAWHRTAEDFLARASELRAADARRERAVVRARVVSCALLAGAVGALLWLARAPGGAA